jgi:alpha-beta hydrolase superfamily lysophospholipase
MISARRTARTWLLLLLALIGAFGVGCVALETKERELVFRPVRDDARTPADQGIAYEEIWLTVPREDGNGSERVHGWWMPGKRADAPAILYLHGVRWSMGNNLFRMVRWNQLGFAVLAIDYRGFGRSDGELPSETQVYADARVAWSELKRRVPAVERRFIYGHSLGAAVALELGATEDGAAGVIAESGFTSLADMVNENNLPVAALLSQRFDALTRAAQQKSPVLFVHGTADRIVPFTMSERLYAAAPEPKRLLLIEGGSHSNYNGTGMDEYRIAVTGFVVLAQQKVRERVAAARSPPAVKPSGSSRGST